MPDGYEISVDYAIAAHGGLKAFRERLLAVRAKVEAQTMCEVVALLSTNLNDASHEQGALMRGSVQLLILAGYDARTSHEIAQTFHEEYPDFIPETAMLAPRETLSDMFGTIYGNVLATMLHNPKNNPVLHAVLFPPHDGPVVVERQAATLVAKVWGDRAEVDPDEMKPLDNSHAESYYFQLTHQRLPRLVSVSPHSQYMDGPNEAHQETR